MHCQDMEWIGFKFLFTVWMLSKLAELANGKPCELYLAPSLFPGTGFGVYSGVNVESMTKLDTASTIMFENLLMQDLPLLKFVYGSDIAEYSMCALGSFMMMNHRDKPNIQRKWSELEPSIINNPRTIQTHPYTTSRSFDLISTQKIAAGEEIFSNYGGEYWFEERHVKYNPQVNRQSPKIKYKLDDLISKGHCLKDISINQSSIPMAGRGVFANRHFVKGELVSISPVMILPKEHIMREETSSLLLNYCLASDSADLLAFPFGVAGMCNHGGKRDSTLAMKWHDWSARSSPTHTPASSSASPDMLEGWTAELLLNASNAPLYLGYYATRNIAEGEELTVDYGSRWEEEWLRYLQVLERWMEVNENKLHAASQDPANGEIDKLFALSPQFRTPMSAHDLLASRVFTFTDNEAAQWLGCGSATRGRSAECADEALQREVGLQLDVAGIRLWREHDALSPVVVGESNVDAGVCTISSGGVKQEVCGTKGYD